MEKQGKTIDFYLGSVSGAGFCGYFDKLATEGRQLYLLKSGPGCGKSTIMRTIARLAAQPVQQIHCASDPDSLDGVVLTEPAAAVVDATAPHVLEPRHPGISEEVVSLYHTMDTGFLKDNQQEILALFERCSFFHDRVTHYVASAACLLADNRRCALPATNLEKARAYANRTVLHHLPKTEGTGSESIRLLSAVTPEGIKTFSGTLPALAKNIVVFHDEYGAASRLILSILRTQAIERGYHIITCPCPIHGLQKIEHIIIPQLSLAFATSNSWHSFAYNDQKNVHCSRFEDKSLLRLRKKRLRFNRRASADLLQQASLALQEAKQSHNRLESLYGKSVDFSKVNEQTTRLLQTLGLSASK